MTRSPSLEEGISWTTRISVRLTSLGCGVNRRKTKQSKIKKPMRSSERHPFWKRNWNRKHRTFYDPNETTFSSSIGSVKCLFSSPVAPDKQIQRGSGRERVWIEGREGPRPPALLYLLVCKWSGSLGAAPAPRGPAAGRVPPILQRPAGRHDDAFYCGAFYCIHRERARTRVLTQPGTHEASRGCVYVVLICISFPGASVATETLVTEHEYLNNVQKLKIIMFLLLWNSKREYETLSYFHES